MFPRTNIENLSVSRLIIGTNWFLGFSHKSAAVDKRIKETMDRKAITAILTAFMEQGVDTLLGARPGADHLLDAVKDAEDRTGRKMILIGTPSLGMRGTSESDDEDRKEIDSFAEIGTAVCMPHMSTTDRLIDKLNGEIRHIDTITGWIRESGMKPGLSTHTPDAVVLADRNENDVATYIQIYNALGFLMQVEVDWINRIIMNAKKPVITIKPLASGALHPFVGLTFSWNSIKNNDMICIGTSSAGEAREVVELSLSILEKRGSGIELQETRSKKSLK